MQMAITGAPEEADSSEVEASGAIDLGGAHLGLSARYPECNAPVGHVFTLVTTTGSLEGAFGGLPDGTTFPLTGCNAPSPALRINYAAHTVTATVVGPAYTWGGEGAPTENTWSNGANWGGVSAPSDTVGTLRFPVLTSPACAAKPATSACYESSNDLTGLEVNELAIDDGAPYSISGNAITLGAGGINATTSSHDNGLDSAVIENMPITLGAPQTWSVTGASGFQSLFLEHVTVSGSVPLDINLVESGYLDLDRTTDFEVGELTLKGQGQAYLGASHFATGALNATDGAAVRVEDGALLTASDAATGPLYVARGTLEVGQYTAAGHLAVAGGVTLSSTATYRTSMNEPGTVAGTNYSQTTATGNVDLAEATLSLEDGATTFEGEGGSCIELTPGDVDTLITTTGSLSGTFQGSSRRSNHLPPLWCYRHCSDGEDPLHGSRSDGDRRDLWIW